MLGCCNNKESCTKKLNGNIHSIPFRLIERCKCNSASLSLASTYYSVSSNCLVLFVFYFFASSHFRAILFLVLHKLFRRSKNKSNAMLLILHDQFSLPKSIQTTYFNSRVLYNITCCVRLLLLLFWCIHLFVQFLISCVCGN